MTDKLSVGGQTITRGTKQVVPLEVTRDLNGSPVTIHAHVVHGIEEGPTVGLLSAIHGSEWFSVNVIKCLLDELKPESLRGSVLAVPVSNPPAFRYLTRCTRDESDTPDLNRSFPGVNNFLTEQLAQKIVSEVMAKSDNLLILDQGSWGWAIGEIMYGEDFTKPEVVERSAGLAKAFGYPCIRAGNVFSVFPGPKSSSGYAGGVMGIPAITVEVGGVGFGDRIEKSWVDLNLRGIFNVLKYLGMFAGELERPDKYLLWKKRWRVNPSVGGYLKPSVRPDQLMKQVTKGEQLGVVLDPYTFEPLETLTAPGEGIIYYLSRSRPVRPGDWGFGVIDSDSPDSRWLAFGN